MVRALGLAFTHSTGSGAKFLGLVLFAIAFTLVSQFEGYFFPVLKDIRIVTAVETQPGVTLISGTGYKLRNCAMDHSEWFWPMNGNPRKIRAENEGTSKSQGIGPYEFENYKVWVGPHDLMTNTTGYAYHRCNNNPLWLTRTKFWDGKTADKGP